VNQTLREEFLTQWDTYFPGANLPIVISYVDKVVSLPEEKPSAGFHCIICDLAAVRDGATRVLGRESIRCGGARRYLGFETEMRPNFAQFLSCGIPGELEGERYKRSPALVEQYLQNQPLLEAPGRSIAFKRWDRLEPSDTPEIVVFFAPPDVLSGLFTLANFDEDRSDGVVTPFGSGCSSVVYHPYRELQSERPRAVLGMFDVSARPCITSDVLSLAIPWPKFVDMVRYMDESFLVTRSWDRVRSRL